MNEFSSVRELYLSWFWHLYVRTEATDNANVNFVKYKEDYYVSTETNYMRRVDPQTLETKEKVSRVMNKKSLWNVTVKG